MKIDLKDTDVSVLLFALDLLVAISNTEYPMSRRSALGAKKARNTILEQWIKNAMSIEENSDANKSKE